MTRSGCLGPLTDLCPFHRVLAKEFPRSIEELLQGVIAGGDNWVSQQRDLLDCIRQQLLQLGLDDGQLQHLRSGSVDGRFVENGGLGRWCCDPCMHLDSTTALLAAGTLG